MTQVVRISAYNLLHLIFGTHGGLDSLLLALLGSYLASCQVGCTESSYFYSARVVESITWTLLE